MIKPMRLIFMPVLVATLLWGSFGLALQRLAPPAHAQAPLPVSTPVYGQVTNRAGEGWRFYGCAGDVISVTLASAAFAPYLELVGAGGETPLAEAGAAGDRATLTGHELTANGVYTVYAGGEARSARGAYSLTLQMAGTQTLTDSAGLLAYGAPVTGTISSRDGQAWALRACAGDQITVSMESNVFDPYLELYAADGDEMLTEADNGGAGPLALIAGYSITRTADYRLVALGAKRSDRGIYTLTLTSSYTPSLDATLGPVTRTTTAQATATPTPRPVVQATATPTPRPAALCTVLVDGLNLRSGPGTGYAPPIAALALGGELRMVARDAAGSWIQVQTAANLTGWVTAAAQYVTCTVAIGTLPVGVIPALPTASPTPLVAQAPTPTPPAFVVLPGGGAGGDYEGEIVTELGMARDVNNTPIFRDRLYFRLEVYDTPDNRRVERVEFSITQFGEEENVEVYTGVEGSAGYCVFGGGEPNCNVLNIGPGATWPGTNRPIENGDYEVNARLFLQGRNNSDANWDADFIIANPNLGDGDGSNSDNGTNDNQGNNPPQELIANIAQTGPGTTDSAIFGALIFQVEAFDPNIGNNDGDGIENVDLEIFDPDGNRVYRRTEGSAHYCAFAGGEPDCNVFTFAIGDAWPDDGPPVQLGRHTLLGTVHAQDGRSKTVAVEIDIQ